MALPAELLSQLPTGVHLAQHSSFSEPRAVLRTGLALDRLLPDGGIPRGAVVEVAVAGSAALGTSLALAACRMAQLQQEASWEQEERAGELSCQLRAEPREQNTWCAFIDSTASLYAPAVVQAGVRLERLLVVRPSLDELSRTALRLVESRLFPLVVVDLVGAPGKPLDISLKNWPRIVRRMAAAVEGSQVSVLLLTDRSTARPIPLPVTQRWEFALEGEHLAVQIAKDSRGRIAAKQLIRADEVRGWGRPVLKGAAEFTQGATEFTQGAARAASAGQAANAQEQPARGASVKRALRGAQSQAALELFSQGSEARLSA